MRFLLSVPIHRTKTGLSVQEIESDEYGNLTQAF